MGQSVPLIAFMGLSYCQRDGGHIRMDLLIGRLKGRLLWIIEAFTSLLTTILISESCLWRLAARPTFNQAWGFTEDISLIIWPFKLMLVVMFIVLLLRLAIQIWGFGRMIFTNGATPIAVPVIEDVETQAKEKLNNLKRRMHHDCN